MLLTNPAAQSLVNITLAEKELERFTQVTWFHNSDVTGNFKASRKLKWCLSPILLSKFVDQKLWWKGVQVFSQSHEILQIWHNQKPSS